MAALRMVWLRRWLLFSWAMLLLGACSSERIVTQSQVKRDPWGNPERFSVDKDEDGNPVMKSELRSHFEGKQSNITAARDFSGKDYMTKSYAKKRWGRSKSFNHKSYQGNTDASRYKMEPWFVRKEASANGKQADAAGQVYEVGPYQTSTAREQNASRLEHPSDAETDIRRRVYKQPEIIDWEDQKDLSVKDTNRLLGRE